MAEQTPDEFDVRAGFLLPCVIFMDGPCDDQNDLCSRCDRRPAVAAELRSQGQEIDRLQGAIAYDRFHAEAEIAHLDEWKAKAASLELEVDRLERQLEGARVLTAELRDMLP